MILRERQEIIMERKAYLRLKGCSGIPQWKRHLPLLGAHKVWKSLLDPITAFSATVGMSQDFRQHAHSGSTKKHTVQVFYSLQRHRELPEVRESNLALRMQCAFVGRFYTFTAEL